MHSIYKVIAFLLQTTLNFQTLHHIVEFESVFKTFEYLFKKLSELAYFKDNVRIKSME